MSPKLRRFLQILLSIVVLIGLLLGIIIPITVRRSFPQLDGEITLEGLDGAVDIYRDSYGVPQIFASTEHDLFFAQGYVHAQDRFWQMDFWRHQGAGRLSELLGDVMLDNDAFLRTLGWERVAREEVAQIDAASMAILEAYSAGVNAYLADHKGTALSLEYAILPILNAGYEPAPWTPLNSMTWAKAMAWDLAGNMDSEILRAQLLKTFTAEQIDELFPPYSFEDRPVIVPNPHLTTDSASLPDADAALAALIAPALQSLDQQVASLNALTGGGMEGLGSNNWVISGDLTDTGMPLLANDPHLGAQMPSIWYEVGLHCAPQNAECSLEVTGFSFAGVPGVIIGHNDRIAWGFTNVGPDTMDLYIEKINPDNPNQYEFEGEWVDMEIITETITVAGGDPVEQTVRLTRHGPLITDVYGLEEFDEESGLDLPENFAIALKWTALEPSGVFRAIWGFNRAQNWDEFRQAASDFATPAQNLVYADVDGNIGYQTPGVTPIRAEGHSGLYPVPGWTGEYEWQGYIPFEDMPFAFNPPEGYIATANNAVVGLEYPYMISHQWAYGQRAQRIVDLIENAPGKISIEYIQQIQGDNMDLNAEVLVPYLLDLSLNDAHLEEVRAILDRWDYQMDMESAPAALFAVFWKHLNAATLDDDFPEDHPSGGGGAAKEFIRHIVDDPDNYWWDDQTTSGKETRDDIFRAAFASAVEEAEDLMGRRTDRWAWGDLHTLTYYNQVMDNVPLINKMFNRGPFPNDGGGGIVNATGWPTRDSYEVVSLPSMRMIVDMSDLRNSVTIHPTGQSGHAYHPNYIDMADPWRLIQYHPMYWDRASIEANADNHLRLLP